jgi:hypothetical protein
LLYIAACDGSPPEESRYEPKLPDGEAGEVLKRAIEAAGGWDRWTNLKDVAFISTLNILDPARQVASESIGWFMAPLHAGTLARMDSIGLPNEVTFGVDGADTWIVSDGEEVDAHRQLALTRFSLVSNLFWFSLPFSLAEVPATVTDLGTIEGDEGARWHRLKVLFQEPNPGVPGEWFVLYFNTDTWLIDRVHARLTAPFLQHQLWIGRWLHYRDWDGLKRERQRQFFPANLEGQIVGRLVAEQFVEHVKFNNGFPEQHYRKPGDRKLARGWGLGVGG